MTVDAADDHPLVLFDGVCNLCDGFVRFVIERDPEGVFRFAPLQSEIAEELLADTDVDPTDLESVVLIEDGEHYVKSDAVVRTAVLLGGVYRLLGPTRYVPRVVRNACYDFVAKRRYGWFGKKDSCMMPTPELEERFLAGGPRSGAADEGAESDGGPDGGPHGERDEEPAASD